jgi:hypothetical protein
MSLGIRHMLPLGAKTPPSQEFPPLGNPPMAVKIVVLFVGLIIST